LQGKLKQIAGTVAHPKLSKNFQSKLFNPSARSGFSIKMPPTNILFAAA
jgi:hypothetical protein